MLLLQYHVLPSPANPQKTWTHLAASNDLIADVAHQHDLPGLDMNVAMRQTARSRPLAGLPVVEGTGAGPFPGEQAGR